MLDESKLSVCTISYGHAAHLGLNWKLASLLNPNVETRAGWLVAEAAADPPRHLRAAASLPAFRRIFRTTRARAINTRAR
jgi:hypothetical protein